MNFLERLNPPPPFESTLYPSVGQVGPRTSLRTLILASGQLRKRRWQLGRSRDACGPGRIQDLQPARMRLVDEIEGKQSVAVLPSPDGK